VELFHWSLNQIDETDIESLLPFVFYYPRWKVKSKETSKDKTQRKYADQVSWL